MSTITNMQLLVGKVLQLHGPFQENQTFTFSIISKDSQGRILPVKGLYKIGISIGEKDYMSFEGLSLEDRQNFQSIPILINNEQIQIGRTYIYEPGFPLSSLTLTFEKGCPSSTLIEIVTIRNNE